MDICWDLGIFKGGGISILQISHFTYLWFCEYLKGTMLFDMLSQGVVIFMF